MITWFWLAAGHSLVHNNGYLWSALHLNIVILTYKCFHIQFTNQVVTFYLTVCTHDAFLIWRQQHGWIGSELLNILSRYTYWLKSWEGNISSPCYSRVKGSYESSGQQMLQVASKFHPFFLEFLTLFPFHKTFKQQHWLFQVLVKASGVTMDTDLWPVNYLLLLVP